MLARYLEREGIPNYRAYCTRWVDRMGDDPVSVGIANRMARPSRTGTLSIGTDPFQRNLRCRPWAAIAEAFRLCTA